MTDSSYGAFADSLKSRQRSIEHADRLMSNLANELIPGLAQEDRDRVARVRNELAALHASAAAAFDTNRNALQQVRQNGASPIETAVAQGA